MAPVNDSAARNFSPNPRNTERRSPPAPARERAGSEASFRKRELGEEDRQSQTRRRECKKPLRDNEYQNFSECSSSSRGEVHDRRASGRVSGDARDRRASDPHPDRELSRPSPVERMHQESVDSAGSEESGESEVDPQAPAQGPEDPRIEAAQLFPFEAAQNRRTSGSRGDTCRRNEGTNRRRTGDSGVYMPGTLEEDSAHLEGFRQKPAKPSLGAKPAMPSLLADGQLPPAPPTQSLNSAPTDAHDGRRTSQQVARGDWDHIGEPASGDVHDGTTNEELSQDCRELLARYGSPGLEQWLKEIWNITDEKRIRYVLETERRLRERYSGSGEKRIRKDLEACAKAVKAGITLEVEKESDMKPHFTRQIPDFSLEQLGVTVDTKYPPESDSMAVTDVSKPDGGPAFNVRARVDLMSLISVDDNAETFKIVFDVNFQWRHPLVRRLCTTVHLKNGSRLCGTLIAGRQDNFLHGVHLPIEGNGSAVDNETRMYCIPDRAFLHIETPDLQKTLGFDMFSKFNFTTLVSEPQILQEEPVRVLDGRTGKVNAWRKYLAEFRCNLDMADFPFDRQILEFQIVPYYSLDRINLIADSDCRCRIVNEQGFPWKVDDKRVGNQFRVTQLSKGPQRRTDRCYGEIRLYVSRKADFYVLNYIVVLGMLTALSFGVFVLPVTDVAGRSGITVTFILTAVSFKLLMASNLPKKPYGTKMERYILSSFALLCGPIVEQAFLLIRMCESQDDASIKLNDPSGINLVGSIKDDGFECAPRVEKFDRYFAISMAVIWLLFNAHFRYYDQRKRNWLEVEEARDNARDPQIRIQRQRSRFVRSLFKL